MLLFACGLAAAEIRSDQHGNTLAGFSRTNHGHERLDYLNLLQGSIMWVHVQNLDAEYPFGDFGGRLSSGKVEPIQELVFGMIQELVFGIPFDWKFDFAGFGFASGTDSYNCCRVFRIPSWFGVISLLVVSTFFLRTNRCHSATETLSGK